MNIYQSVLKKINPVVRSAVSRFSKTLRKNPYLTTCVCVLIYLLLFQFPFVTHGDAWAESFAEYLDESVKYGWPEVFAQNWAGYFTVVPSFIAKLYVWAGLPIGYIDYFFRMVVIISTVLSVALVSLKANRTIIKNDGLRLLLALGLIIILGDVASFSFINVWYIALLPIIFMYLNPSKFSQKLDIGIGFFGGLMALTKPFIIIIPIALYRLIRSKQIVGPLILLAAAALQTYQIIFNDKRQIVESAEISIQQMFGGLFTGSGTALLKLVNIAPTAFWHIVVANIVLVTILILLVKKRGVLIATVLSATFLYAVYTYVLAPDGSVYSSLQNYKEIYNYTFKSQRELLINGTLLIAVFLLLSDYFSSLRKSHYKHLKKYKIVIIMGIALLFLYVIYKPINVTGSGVTTDPLNPFRYSLNSNQPACVPLAPTQLFIEQANWVYSHKGVCTDIGHDLNLFKPDFTTMRSAAHGVSLDIDAQYFRLDKQDIMTLVIPVVNTGDREEILVLVDSQTGVKFTAPVAADSSRSQVQFATFNMSGTPHKKTYRYTLENAHKKIVVGYFKNTMTPMNYSYFINKHP